MGGGTTDIAVISLGGIVNSESVKVAGDRMDEVIVNHMRRKHGLLIGDYTAEKVKQEVGSAYPLGEKKAMKVRGRDLVSGIPKTVDVDDTEIYEALSEPIGIIVDTIKQSLEKTPPELAGDIIDRGVVLAGGGSMIAGLDTRLKAETGLPIITVTDPLTSVVSGVGRVLEDIDLLKQISNLSSLSPQR